MQVIDDFLPEEVFTTLCDATINNRDFPLFYDVKLESSSVDPTYNFQYVHKFYDDDQPASPYYDVIENIFSQRLGVKSWIRIKLNMTFSTPTCIEWGSHTDVPVEWNSKTAIFYLNSNNGYTKILDAPCATIESVQNRLLIFDGKLQHTAASSTSYGRRFVINFNYF
ncbi:DNA endonuclease V [Synechococcus phage S-SZBM1]|uniref:DNA endonuclease V n=1 Tax=Synechococcus phage S-SZBM1 TaxID=2926475 RepID=A0AC61TSW2_9CAUD|nr:DNA endonuclease V [Synechococcus phage S-SZBM1]UNH61174.1 DNA endonuclease V [Synechococcus phage S-SZBM1]